MRTQSTKRISCITAAVILLAGATLTPLVQADVFTGLGINGGIYAATNNGSTIVGYNGNAYPSGFVWKPTGSFPLGNTASGVSEDGSVVVGWRDSGAKTEPFRWTSATGTVGLGLFGNASTYAIGVSPDGQSVYGHAYAAGQTNFFSWTTGGGYVPTGTVVGNINGVSANGSVYIGSQYTYSGFVPFRYSTDTGYKQLGTLGGYASALPYGISADSTSIVGMASPDATGANSRAVIWVSDSPIDLQINSARAYGVSGDGTLVSGYYDQDGSQLAFIWDATNGARNLQSVLESRGLDLTGWTLSFANVVSADGTSVFGYGLNPNGEYESFMAHTSVPLSQIAGGAAVPEPSTYALLALGTGLFFIAKRRQMAWC